MKHRELLSNFAVSTTLRARSFSAFVCSKTRFSRRSSAVILVVFAALSHTPALKGQSLTITTLAGLAGSPGSVDGTGSAARFSSPIGVATDSGGNIYVTDSSNHTIRKISPAGAVTTLAGLAGSFGSNDGTGSAARFRFPDGVATDSSGNVYVADPGNDTIRKINPGGVVTTLAGLAGARGSADGVGSAARFSSPLGLATDSGGNVYVADQGNHTIRRITPVGAVTTLAGLAGTPGSSDGTGSAARFRFPIAVATDGSGNVYVADTKNHTIRKITPTGMVTTLAGLAGTPGSSDGTGSAARFNDPDGVAIDSSGNVYVADFSNHTIRKVTLTGAVTTPAGLAGNSGSVNGTGSAARFNGPAGVATSGGEVYVADMQNHTIRVGRAAQVPDPQASVQFTASPSTIRAGQSTTLVFSTQNAVSVTIDNGVTVSGTSGSVTVTPSQTTTYTLTATSAAGTKTTAQATVTVITTPAVIVSALPQGMLQSAGVGGATDRASFTNVGGSLATISLTRTGSFFTIAPTSPSLTIAPGATGMVTITASAQPSGTYDGSIAASGSGIQGVLTIPVRLLVSAPPQGTVIPTPQTNRVDVTQPTGSLQITNSGSATLQGILVSDVPWLIPQGGVITIGAGQSVTVTFSIDRSKRPDGDNPIGAVTGSITLVYLDSPSSGATVGMIHALADTPATGRTKFQVVDLAAPATSMSAIPPLGVGEIALFLPGFAKKANLLSDLTLVNSSPAILGDLRLFFALSGVPTTTVQRALLDPIPPSGKAFVSDLVKGIFGRSDGQVGGLQVRATNAGRLNLAAAVTNPINAAGLFSGSIASQRSDRGIGFNEKTVLTGVRSDAGARTDLYVQEVAGQAGSVRTDFLGEDAAVLNTRTDPISAFAILELANEAPSGAVTASVTNLGSASRIIAQGLVFDEQTGDPTNLVDWNRRNGTAANEAQIILLAASGVAGGKKTRTDLWITNTGSTTATGTLSFYGVSTRKRSVRRSSSGSSAGVGRIESMEVSKTITVEAGKTRVIRDVLSTEFSTSTASGYLLYTTASGTVAITSGTFKYPIAAQPGASGSSGTSVPVVASSTGLKLGETRQFSSLEDASSATIATAERATYRTGFGLVETSGKSATVKVTLGYQSVVPGGLASAPLSVSKEYALIPRGSIFVDQIGRSIFGPERGALGDLHDLSLEIAVTSGEGRVIPYTLATENGSGDTILRIE